MNHKHTKLLSVLLTLCLIVGMIPWTVLPARAEVSGSGTESSPWLIGKQYPYDSVKAVLYNGTLTISGAR